MDKLNKEMDEQLAEKIASLQANDDETGDGRVDVHDLKVQLDRVEAHLDLQDKQNRRLLKNQRITMIVFVVLVIALCGFIAIMWVRLDTAYQNVLEACTQVNELADTLQNSLDTIDTEDLNTMMQTMPEIVDKLNSIDVDALNDVLTRMPVFMDAITALQEQVSSLTSSFSGLSGLSGLFS